MMNLIQSAKSTIRMPVIVGLLLLPVGIALRCILAAGTDFAVGDAFIGFRFAEQFAQRLDLTRIVIAGDPVPDLLSRLYGGYHHFGKELRWTAPGYSLDDKQYVRMYLDQAVRNYYNK